MGVSRRTISSVEGGKYVARLQPALKMARFFRCFTDDMFRLAE
jgi:DNA-binding XRE family transcriptional regulator